ncbi:MAG: bifunctional oligoribonuclease/PAP phosphatase NrnA [Candidatus Eisenbacteria bacterium]|nr:bifunctional oligoribonuclease/PAP phosphatase NrnA [Candidatus Eisenbacteria bacterium]
MRKENLVEAKELLKIREVLKNEVSFTVTTHVDPDVDGLASQLALFSLLRESGKEVNAMNQDPVPSIFSFLPNAQSIISLKDNIDSLHQVLIVVDTGSSSRIGYPFDALRARARTIVNIDHHKGNGMFGDVNLVDSSASAAAILIADLIEHLGVPIGKERATLLYAGILADTGSFRFPNTSARGLMTAALLADEGIDVGKIASGIYAGKSLASMKLLSLALSSLEVAEGGKIAVMSLSMADFKKTGAKGEDSEGFASYAKSISGTLIGIFLREAGPGTVRVSFRSDGMVDVDKIAGLFGGGGHAGASGAQVSGTVEEVKKEVLVRVAPFVSSLGHAG